MVTVTGKWYATLRHPKMHPHTKFGIPTSKNIGDMHRTRSGTDGRTDGRTDSAITICLPKFLWGHKNVKMPTIVGILTFISMINTPSGRLSARNFFIWQYLSFSEQLKYHA